MNPFDYYKNGIMNKYAKFEGRSRRTEFWYFALFNFLISLGTATVGYVLGTSFLNTLYSLAVLVPALAMGVRRLHDTNKPGWWLLIGLVPIVGFIVLIVFFVQDSDEGSNEYGPNPKGVMEVEDHLV